MDNDPKHSKCDLPNTPRVCDTILKYYQELGQERDLKKFMRLYSPATSRMTQCDDCISLDSCYKRSKSRETITSDSSCEALYMMPLNAGAVSNSKSLPNIVQGETAREKEYFPSNDVIVTINIEAVGEKEKILSTSAENLKTPKKNFKNTKTQTPESVAKTHRRLEWDSLGDIGYKKSMSTSNISTIERSLLQKFFKENSVASEPGPSASAREEQNSNNEHEIVQKLKISEMEHSTPPLACSTLVVSTEIGAKPKMMSQSTSSTSLTEKFEKYAQTSLIKPPATQSQEVQCSISSSNSVIEGTATPSSFEYYSSKSSKSSNIAVNTNSQKQFKPLEHPFITSITDLLMKRKALGEKNQQRRHHDIHELQTKFKAALNENKENQSHSTIDSSAVSSFSLSQKAPELDLGIQLICSLIDAKSISSRQKKQLIRDIIKRITCLEAEDNTYNSTTINSSGGTNTNSSECRLQNVYDLMCSNNNDVYKQESMVKLKGASKLGVSLITTDQVNTQEKSLTSTTNTTDNFCGIIGGEQSKSNFNSKPLHISKSQRFQQHENKNGCKQFLYKKNLNENTQKENSTKVLIEGAASGTINKETQSEPIMMEGNKQENKQQASNCKLKKETLETKYLKIATENKTNRCTQTSKTSITSTSATTIPDLTTQKFIVSSNNESSNTDAEQPTMREWLNPLTQSEIEYEEKKQIVMRKKAEAQQQKLMKKSKHDCGRTKQINWIENEIKRLECLKHLLLKDETATKSSTSASSLDHSVQKNLNKESTQSDKLYDTVYSDKSSVLSESAEQLVQEIEIILEESNEDVVNLKDHIKRTKNRKKETQIMYEREEDSLKKSKMKTKPKFRIVNENINVHEEQLLNARNDEVGTKQRKQREKIDTPTTNKSEEPESLKCLVQQRKREFIKAYASKKQRHYEALKQQQKEDLKYLNTQRKLVEKATTVSDSEHYSVTHTLSRKYPLLLKPSEGKAKIKTYDTLLENICSMKSVVGRQENNKPNSHKAINTSSANTNNTTTNSSSSMFCMSSDISVPMGSQNTSSTPTTTHQYDDVAAAANVAAVGVQTSDSIKRSKPIYGPTRTLPFVATTHSTTACIQVKPKGIAYVIEFDDNKHALSSPPSDSDINSNDMLTKSNKKSHHSITTQVTNSLTPLKASEPVLTLQEHLEKGKPKFLQNSKQRKAILNQLQSMRQERDRQLREIIDNTSFNSLDRRLKYLPPPPIQKARILKTKEMKALNNKRFANLPEVVAKQEREIEEKNRRSNRILRDIFNKRLQKRVRNGKLSLNHSRTVI